MNKAQRDCLAGATPATINLVRGWTYRIAALPADPVTKNALKIPIGKGNKAPLMRPGMMSRCVSIAMMTFKGSDVPEMVATLEFSPTRLGLPEGTPRPTVEVRVQLRTRRASHLSRTRRTVRPAAPAIERSQPPTATVPSFQSFGGTSTRPRWCAATP